MDLRPVPPPDSTDRPSGSNAGRSRAWNRGLVLGLIQSGAATGRAEIARASGLTTQAVSNIIADLADAGMIREVGRRAAGRGMPVRHYAIEAGGGHALGFEVRPDALRAALMNLSGQAEWQQRVPLHHADPISVAAAVTALRDAALSATGTRDNNLLGAGIVMPGPFSTTGLADAATELPGWSSVVPRDVFAGALGLDVVVENDANAAAVAERVMGVARGLSSYAYLYFGAGLGLGILSDGRLVRGACGNAGEIGHIPINGRRLEDVASRHALARRLAAAGLPGATVEELAAAADHPATVAWLDAAADALGEAVLMLENLLDPETVILGGALPDALIDGLIARIRLSDASLANRPDRQTPRLMRGASGRLTAALGAGALVLDRAFTPRITA
jgi:predicted NBD/HSP70 family sugar kinase